MKYVFLLYLIPGFATFFGSFLYRRIELYKIAVDKEKRILKPTEAKRITALTENRQRELYVMSFVPVLNIITSFLSVLYVIRELLDGITNLIESGFLLWEKLREKFTKKG